MPTRPLNTLTVEEVIQLLNTPAFYEFFEFAYDMYYLRQRFVQFTAMGEFAVRDPPAPVITPRNDHAFGGIAAAPITDFGALTALATAGPIRSGLVGSTLMAQAPPVFPQQQEANAMSWAQLCGGLNPGAEGVAPFDMEAAPMGPGINVGQGQTLDSTNYAFTPTQAALPQLTDLGNDSGMNDNWDLLLGTALYSGAVQDPSYYPLSPTEAQTPVMSPLSDSDDSMGEAGSGYSSLFSPTLSELATYGDLADEHEEEASSDDDESFAFFDN